MANTFTNENRHDALQDCSEDIRTVYSAKSTFDTLVAIADQYKIEDPDTRSRLIETVGDTMLGLYTPTDLQHNLQANVGVDAQTALEIASELSRLMSPLSNRTNTATPPITAQRTATPVDHEVPTSIVEAKTPSPATPTEPVVVPEQTPVAHAVAEKTKPEDAEAVVRPLRTMEADMDRIHGYGAYRKMFPDAEVNNSDDGEVVHAAPQDEVLKKG